PVNRSGVNMPTYTGYGIGYRELGCFLLKYSAFQLPLVVPFATICGLAIAWAAELPLAPTSLIAFKLGWVMFAIRFFTVIFGFSGGTNDSSAIRIRSIFLLLSLLASLAVFGGLAISGVLVPHWIGWGLLAGAILAAFFGFLLYGWFYNAHRF